jgi:hypothetical protein
MDINKVIANLDQTILGKRMLLEGYKADLENTSIILTRNVIKGIAMMLDINIIELERIRADLVLCKTASEGWGNDIDRQSGAFTQDEINPTWK